MPPKKVAGRGIRGPRGGRGRGRGDASTGPPTPIPNVGPDHEMEGSTAIPAGPSPELPSTPLRFEDDAMDIDPNSSPATQPTETPAPTPIRPPQPPIRPPQSTVTAEAPKKSSKFKPRNVRRNEEDRSTAKEAEEARLRGINREALGQQRRENALARKGGRGGRMGERPALTGVASGPFAEASAPDKRPSGAQQRSGGGPSRSGVGGGGGAGGGGGGGGGRGSSSTTRVKTEGNSGVGNGTANSGRKAKEDGEFSEPEYPDDDDTPRVNIESLVGISEDDDEETSLQDNRHIRGRVKSHYDDDHSGLKPVRLLRVAHKARVSQLSTDPTIKVNKDAKDDDTIMVDETRSTAVAAHKPDPIIKMEPGEDTAAPLPPRDTNNAIDGEVEKAIINGEAEKAVVNGEAKPPSSSTLARKVKPRVHSKKDKKPVIQTAEDRAEYERHLDDVRILRDELGSMLSEPRPPSQDAEGNIQMADGEQVKDGQKDQKEGRLYLFQFPPVLPKLYDPETQEKPVPLQSKSVQVKKEKDDDVEVIGSTSKKTVDLTKGQEGDEEDKGVILTEEELRAKDSRKQREQYVDTQGYIGKLIVRESGRVELDWGGTRMLVGKGMTTEFFSNGVILDSKELEEGRENEGGFLSGNASKAESEGKAMSMGGIRGKFVVTPDWENMM